MSHAATALWVKICGLRTEDAVAAALEAGADAIGFVFASSPRRVTAGRAAELAAPAHGRARVVAVTQHPTQAELDAIFAELMPDVLQTDHRDFDRLRVPISVAHLPVLRSGQGAPSPLPKRALVEGARSGSGTVGDWAHARALSERIEIVLAGGLHSGNVAAAVAAVRPFGVDVSSGVETAPGVKSADKIFSFVQVARAAHAETQ
jgi:phosphoribosylanthranilate isomerase